MNRAAPRRSPSLFGAVVLAHAALLGALLTPLTTSPLRDGGRGPARSGSDDIRFDVALLDALPALPPVAGPRPISVPKHVAVEGLAAPALELGESEPTGEEKLRGVYLGQVRARIERAWETITPPASSGELSTCDVMVTQDPRGGVLDVAFGDCRVEPAAREALVRTIRGASPLPAPPSDLPFSSQVRLNLRLASRSP